MDTDQLFLRADFQLIWVVDTVFNRVSSFEKKSCEYSALIRSDMVACADPEGGRPPPPKITSGHKFP